MADWTLLSDLAFADLVLWLPTWHGGGFVAADQVRPTTGPTSLFDDIVGQFAPRGRRPLLDRAVAARAVVADRGVGGPAPVEAIPVIRAGRVLGVIERHYALNDRAVGSARARLPRGRRRPRRNGGRGHLPARTTLGAHRIPAARG